MRNLHFGPLRKSKGTIVGAFALHIQCPWRLEAKGKILTGFHDHYEPAIGDAKPNGSLQHQVLE